MSNPAKPKDPVAVQKSVRIAKNIENDYVRPTVATTAQVGNDPIIAPPPPPQEEFFSDVAVQGNRLAGADLTYTLSDHEKYMKYKQRKMEQLQGETLKQSVREMYDKFKTDRNFAEMNWLEQEFPWIKEEKQKYVELQKWALEMLGEYYSTGGKPTQKMLEFTYAAKTDPALHAIVQQLQTAFNTPGNSVFGSANWKNGWLTNYFYPKVVIPPAVGFEPHDNAHIVQGPNGQTNAWMRQGTPTAAWDFINAAPTGVMGGSYWDF